MLHSDKVDKTGVDRRVRKWQVLAVRADQAYLGGRAVDALGRPLHAAVQRVNGQDPFHGVGQGWQVQPAQ